MSENSYGVDRDSYQIMNEELDMVEISYENECFDTDADQDVIETEDCIKYKAPIGPNIVVSKTPTRDGRGDQHGEVLTSAISVAPRNPIKAADKGPITRGRTQTLSKRRSTPQSALRESFRRLQLGFSGKSTACRTNGGMSVQIRKCSSLHLNQKGSNSSLMTYPNFFPEGVVQKRLNSAKRLQIKDLMSKVRQLENAIEDVKIENRTLRTVHYRQDMALRKYEGADADLPKMLRHHKNEVHCLQTNLRKVNARTRGYEDTMRGLNRKVQKLDQENKKLIGLVEEGNLEERHDLKEQLNAMTFHAQRGEEKLIELSRHTEILEKNHIHQIDVEQAKLRSSNKKLFDANQKIDQLNELIRQKDRIINYLRIRTCRNPDLEPPVLKKMLADQNKRLQGKPNRRSSYGSRSVTPERHAPDEAYRKNRSFVEKAHPRQSLKVVPAPTKQAKSESEEDDESQSRSAETSGRSFAKDYGSGTGTLGGESTNRISQTRESSEESYVTDDEAESNECVHGSGNNVKELDPNNLEEYYHFDEINVEELSVYTPTRSLYIEALESSCNVSSLNSRPGSAVMAGDGDARPSSALTPRNSSEQFVTSPDRCKHENIIGAAGDAGAANLSDEEMPKGGHGNSNRSNFGFKTEMGNYNSKTEIGNYVASKTQIINYASKTKTVSYNSKSKTDINDEHQREEQLIPPPGEFSSKVEIMNSSETHHGGQSNPPRSRFTSKTELVYNNGSENEGQGQMISNRTSFASKVEAKNNRPECEVISSQAKFVEIMHNRSKQSEVPVQKIAKTETMTNKSEGHKVNSPVNSGSKTGINETQSEGQPRPTFASQTETGFISQRSEIVPSAEKVRLAQLKARYSYSGRLSGRPILSDSSDSHDESGEDSEATEADLDDKLPIENMKMHFKVPKANERNLNETNSFKSVSRLNNIFRELKLRDDSAFTVKDPSPRMISDSAFVIPKMYSPKVVTPEPLSGKSNDGRSLFPKVGTPYPNPSKELLFPERKFPEITPGKGMGSLVPDTPKKSAISAFDSPIFSANSSVKNLAMKPKSFFDKMPTPPAASTQHFDFELASIFKKRPSDQKVASPKTEETEVSKRTYHDNLTTTFQKKNLQQQQVHPPRKLTPVKGNNAASPGTSTVNVHNPATKKTSGIWK